jgi:hypothetical protein
MGAMKTIVPMAVMVLAGLAALPPAQAQGKARYEPVQRTRVGALDGCMKDEVMNGAFCVKQCAPGFKLELATRTAACVATSAEAKVPPPPAPEYVAPAKKEPGAKGT